MQNIEEISNQSPKIISQSKAQSSEVKNKPDSKKAIIVIVDLLFIIIILGFLVYGYFSIKKIINYQPDLRQTKIELKKDQKVFDKLNSTVYYRAYQPVASAPAGKTNPFGGP